MRHPSTHRRSPSGSVATVLAGSFGAFASVAVLGTLGLAACTGTVNAPGGKPGPGNPPTTTGTGATGTPGVGTGGTGGTGGGGIVTPGSGGTIGVTGSGGATVALDCSKPKSPRMPLRRLTRFEYNNSVRDILGMTYNATNPPPADVLPGEELGNGFQNEATSLSSSRILIDGYRTVAKDIALKVAADTAAAAKLGACPTAQLNETTCSTKIIADLGLRLFRRPLDAQETTAITAMFTAGRTAGDFATGVRTVLEWMLQSPQFLYRFEFGEPVENTPGLTRPTPYEMATRLSYLFWGSAPDVALLDAAKAGTLRTKAQILAQAERLLADRRTRDVVRFFHGQLYGIRGLDALTRDPGYFPKFTPGMGSLMRRETEEFIDYVVWSGTGTFKEMMSAPYTMANSTLATFYGFTGATGDAFTKVNTNPAQRAGLLTQASIMAITNPGSRNDPVVRGKWVYNNILCQTVPDPPQGVAPVGAPAPGLTTRQRFEEHRQNTACVGCHTMLDPIGFGFEHLDGIGLWRDTEDGLTIDDSGTIPATTDAAGDFKGPVELANKLANSRDAQKCFAGKWLTYAYGRFETPQDDCTRASIQDAFAASGGDIKKLMVALTQTDAFLYGPSAVGQN
jgi:hypothetical protein